MRWLNRHLSTLVAIIAAATILAGLVFLPARAKARTGDTREAWYQTVPTRTPTPEPPTATATLAPPTVTPTNAPTAEPPTVTPTPVQPTSTPRPDPTDTPEPGATDTPIAPPVTATALPDTATPTSTLVPGVTPTPTAPPATAGLGVAISGPQMLIPGQVFTVSLQAVNIGTVQLELGEVTLSAPPAFTLNGGQASAGAFDAGRRLWRLTNVQPNEAQTLVLQFSVGSGVPRGSVLDIAAHTADRSAILTVGLPPAFLPPVGSDPYLDAGF